MVRYLEENGNYLEIHTSVLIHKDNKNINKIIEILKLAEEEINRDK